MTTLDQLSSIKEAFNLSPADMQAIQIATLHNQDWLSDNLTQKAVQNSVINLIKKMSYGTKDKAPNTTKLDAFKFKFTKSNDQVTVTVSNDNFYDRHILLSLDKSASNNALWDKELVMATLITESAQQLNNPPENGVDVGNYMHTKVRAVITKLLESK